MTLQDYDLVVIGSGPAGQKAAINAAKRGKRVAVIEHAGMIGRGSVHSGTIPSKTMRDAVLYLTGLNERAFYGQDYLLRDRASLARRSFVAVHPHTSDRISANSGKASECAVAASKWSEMPGMR